MAFREIENLIPMKEPAEKTRMFRTLLKAQGLSYFEHHLIRRLEAEDSDVQALSYFEHHLMRRLEVENSEVTDNELS
jgi:hypothetical protein